MIVRLQIALSLLAIACVHAQTPRRLALVIGISAYDPSVGEVNALGDAHTVASALNDIGFTTTLKEDLTADALKAAMTAFASSVHERDVVFVYYAGHGIQIDGSNYILGRDFSGKMSDVARQGVLFADLVNLIGKRSPSLKVFVIDACRNNPFDVNPNRGLADIAQASYDKGTYIAMAAAAGHVANDDGSFAKHLASAIRAPGLELNDVFLSVRNSVVADSKGLQTPVGIDTRVEKVFLVPKDDNASLTPAAREGAHTFFGYKTPDSGACVEVIFVPSEFPREATSALKAYFGLYLKAADRSFNECSTMEDLQLRTTVRDVGNGCIEVEMNYRLTPVRQSEVQAKTGMAAGRRECYGADAERTEKSATESAFAKLRDVLLR